MTYRSIKSAERTLALFEVFASQQRPLTIGDIAKLLSIPQPSATMLVYNLVALGYLEQHKQARTYTPTIRIALLGSWIHQRFTLDRQLELRLDELQKAVGEITYIGIQNGAYMQPIVFIRPTSPARFLIDPQSLYPMALTATGKALLSVKSDPEALALVRRTNAEAEDAHLRLDTAALLQELRQIRELGYAESGGELMAGIKSIAMVMPPLVGRSPMAVAVGGEFAHIDAKKDMIVQELRNFVDAFAGEATAFVA